VIPGAAITAWGTTRPWPNRAAIEQDLLLARTIIEIYRHPLLTDELVFRGGTCFHQLHLPVPLRYSEDLDFVRSTHSGIGPILDALRGIAATLNLEVKGTTIGQHPKMMFRATSEEGLALRIKLEFNTHETSPARSTAICSTSGWRSTSSTSRQLTYFHASRHTDRLVTSPEMPSPTSKVKQPIRASSRISIS